MHFDGMIFDLDGTLWDCSAASAEAFNRTYEEFGIARRVTKEFVESISGKPTAECDEILLAGVPNGIRGDVSRRLNELELSAIRARASNALYPGVDEGLRTLRRNYELFVVSNCGERYLEIFLEHTSIGELFVDSECFGRTRKPKHENIRAVVERRHLQSPCYLGDTAGDEIAAAKAEVSFFHARYGFGRPTENPVSFGDFGELVNYFTELVRRTTVP